MEATTSAKERRGRMLPMRTRDVIQRMGAEEMLAGR